MKFGQLLSMDAGDLLPPEFGAILARLRADARAMPMRQLASVLDANWGHGWDRHFRQFSFTPVAAASIGQVHLAQTKDGRRLAIKVQYPGVRQSIDSDVDNVATLLRISGLLPSSLDVGPLLREAKRQLHAEADYLGEGALLSRYAGLLADTPEFMLPEVHGDLTTESVLSMSCMGGVPVESLLHAPQAERDRVLGLLFRLLFREIFEFHLIQTDPNFANYRYDVASRRLILLDFGATRGYPAVVVDAYRRLMASAVAGDRQEMSVAASAIGYFGAAPSAILGLTSGSGSANSYWMSFCTPANHCATPVPTISGIRICQRASGLALSTERDSWHTPPADALFLHRKAGGLYLLAARLKARVDIRALFLPYASGQAPS